MIPETAEIEGTIRAVSEKTRSRVHDGIRRAVDGIAAAHGCTVEVDIEQGYPVTVNDATSPTSCSTSPLRSSAPTRSCASRTRSWAPRTGATSCSRYPER